MPEKQIAMHPISAEETQMDMQIPPLEELIAEIDSETGYLPHDETPKVFDFQDQTDVDRQNQIQYIRFSIANRLFAVPLTCALEIGEHPDITPLPNIPEWILGISNIRGEIVSMVDLCRFLRFTLSRRTSAKRFIVLQNNHIKIGILVDQIMGMLSLSQPETEIKKSPYVDGDIALFTKGVIPFEKKSINVIDIEKMLSSPRIIEFQG